LKYTKITLDSILPKVSVYDPRRLTFDLSYAITEKIQEEAAKKLGHHDLPILIFSETHITKQNSFQNKQLENAFASPIETPEKPPTFFYPFSDQDHRAIIAMHIFQTLVALTLRKKPDEPLEIEPETILSRTHKIWEHIDESRKRILREKANSIIREYHKKQLKNHLEKIKGKTSWKITKSLEAFRKECQKILEELEKQQTLKEF